MVANMKRAWAILGWLLLVIHVSVSSAQTPLTTIDMPQGGRIVYGKVQGADTQGAAMTHVLRVMHQSCGDKPKIGNVFRMRGTDSVGLFFTVVNRPAGNVQVAGLIIAAGSGPHQAEAALVSDRADRFGTTINPMLEKLFGVWHPAGAAISSSARQTPAAPASTSPTGKNSGPVPRLHTVSAPDNSATIGIPDGWTLDPRSGGGTMLVSGPRGEQIALSMTRAAIDPWNPQQVQMARSGFHTILPGTLVYPFRGDMVKSFPEMFQAWRRANGKPPAQLQVDEIKPMPAVQGNHCAFAKGHVDPDGKGMQTFSSYMCAFDPAPANGMYLVTLSHSMLPNALADQELNTMQAIIDSWRVNQQVVNQQVAAANQRMNANTQALIRQNQMQVDRIHQIGAEAAARYNATQAANDAQHAAWNASQDANSRNTQGLSNYLLDQTVIHDVQDPNTHVTVWNRAAEAWKKAYPDRIEEVPTSQYINGQDY